MLENFDLLYQIFEKHLHSDEFEDRHEQELIDAVIHEYMLVLVQQGMSPHTRHEQMVQDLGVEIRDMIKMKTYGHFDLRHYNLFRKKSG